jgi:hypothetical protein
MLRILISFLLILSCAGCSNQGGNCPGADSSGCPAGQSGTYMSGGGGL